MLVKFIMMEFVGHGNGDALYITIYRTYVLGELQSILV